MDQYVGEIRMFAGNFAPVGWALCNGQLLSIAQNDMLFALIGTTYGGDGQTTFALPDLRGRIPVSQGALVGGSTYTLGQRGGVETVTLTEAQMPAHTHTAMSQAASGTLTSPENAVWAGGDITMYLAAAANATMRNPSTTIAGSGQPHDNMMPFLCVNFIIATEGLWPQQQ